MGKVTTLTSKGQVTIPKAIRDELGLKPHDKITCTIEDGHVSLRKAYPSLEDIVGKLPTINVPMEEWDDIIQEEVAQRYAEKFL